MQFHIRKTPITPLIISIPHAGSYYPKEFLKYKSIDIKKLKIMEDFKTDTFIDKINLNLADIFIAECSRAVVDLNRSRQSLDSSMFNSTIKTIPNEEILLIKSGLGVIPSKCYTEEIFKSKLPNFYISKMLEKYYDPFHKKLSKRINYLKSKFGVVYLIDIHSTPTLSNNNKNFPDVIIGDNFGKSSEENFKNDLINHFKNLNLRLSINSPYSGGYITRRYGEKDKNVNVIQLEISKNYYMNENTFELKENLNNVKNIFKSIVEKLNVKTSIAAE